MTYPGFQPSLERLRTMVEGWGHLPDSARVTVLLADLRASRDHAHTAAAAALEWARSGRLLYTLAQDGWRRGEPVLVNRFTVRVDWDPRYASDAEGEALIASLETALSSAELVPGESSRDDQPLPNQD